MESITFAGLPPYLEARAAAHGLQADHQLLQRAARLEPLARIQQAIASAIHAPQAARAEILGHARRHATALRLAAEAAEAALADVEPRLGIEPEPALAPDPDPDPEPSSSAPSRRRHR